MRVQTVNGIVIKRSSLNEADRLITLFTSQIGKVTTLAKGVRKITSKRLGSLELFNEIRASLHTSNSSLPIIGEVEVINSHSAWKKHLGRVTLGYSLIETIDKLIPENEPYPSIYKYIISDLYNISNLDQSWKTTSDQWLVQIVQELGYLPKDQSFIGDIHEFIKDLASKPLYSPCILKRLSRRV